jgi:hypothetical protein
MSTLRIPPIDLKVRSFARPCRYPMIALVVLSIFPLRALAQEGHAHTSTQQQQELTPDLTVRANELVKLVRQSTERFKDVSVAEAEGYQLQFGCVSGENSGAMGLHYVNGDLVGKGELDPTHPQIVIYESTPGGKPRLIGADFLLFQAAWDKKKIGPPELMGQLFHLFTAPNRFGLPSFYTLHVWAWKDNPNGAFVNWHPKVSCEQFNPSPN